MAVFPYRTTFQQDVAAAGTPVQLADNPVPEGMYLWLFAPAGNTGNITFGFSSAEADSDGTSFAEIVKGLRPIRLKVDNANRVWVDAHNNGDDVYCYIA